MTIPASMGDFSRMEDEEVVPRIVFQQNPEYGRKQKGSENVFDGSRICRGGAAGGAAHQLRALRLGQAFAQRPDVALSRPCPALPSHGFESHSPRPEDIPPTLLGLKRQGLGLAH